MTYTKQLDIYSEIFHTNDGPVTKFVAIHRALELAVNISTQSANITEDTADIANVLYEALKDFKELPSNELHSY